MLYILLFFACGVAAGWLLRKKRRLGKVVERITTVSIGTLIFMLGLSAGGHPEVSENFSRLGLASILLTIGAIAGSILATWPLAHFLSREAE